MNRRKGRGRSWERERGEEEIRSWVRGETVQWLGSEGAR